MFWTWRINALLKLFSPCYKQVYRYTAGMCVRCWYLVDGWRWHGLYWRERSKLVRWTESSSCFGKVMASCSPFTLLVCLGFFFFIFFIFYFFYFYALIIIKKNVLIVGNLTGQCIMAQMLLCSMMSWVQLMYKLLSGSYTMPFWVLLCREKLDCSVPTTCRLLCTLFYNCYSLP